MACRCDDIAAAEHDREVLRDMLDRICDTENRYNEIRNRYGDIINTMGMAIFLLEDEYNSAKQRIENTVAVQEDDIRKYKSHVNNSLSNLENKISRMEREDEWFHAHDDDDD